MRCFLALTGTVVLLAACAGRDEGSDAASRRVSGYGLSIDLPPGWNGDVTKPPGPSAPLLRAANFPLGGVPPDIGQAVARDMDDGDLLITAADYGVLRYTAPAFGSMPITIRASDIGSFEGFVRPVATKSFAVGDHGLQAWVVFGSQTPDAHDVAAANDVLATLDFDG